MPIPNDLPWHQFVAGVLEQAKALLSHTKYLTPVVFILTEGEVNVIGMQCKPNDKYPMYESLWAEWIPKNPEVIVMLNDTYTFSGPPGLAKRRAGRLATLFEAGDPDVKEAISLMVFPRGANAWAALCPYRREPDGIAFDPEYVNRNDSGQELGGELGPVQWLGRANIAYDIATSKKKKAKEN